MKMAQAYFVLCYKKYMFGFHWLLAHLNNLKEFQPKIAILLL